MNIFRLKSCRILLQYSFLSNIKRGSLIIPLKMKQRQRSTLLECAFISHSAQHGDKAIVHTHLLRGQSLLRLRFS